MSEQSMVSLVKSGKILSIGRLDGLDELFPLSWPKPYIQLELPLRRTSSTGSPEEIDFLLSEEEDPSEDEGLNSVRMGLRVC